MLTAQWNWRQRSTPQETINALEHHLGITALAARLLVARGVEDPAHAEVFMRKKLADLHRPQLLSGMEIGAKRLAKAINLTAGFLAELALPLALVGIGGSLNLQNIKKASGSLRRSIRSDGVSLFLLMPYHYRWLWPQ